MATGARGASLKPRPLPVTAAPSSRGAPRGPSHGGGAGGAGPGRGAGGGPRAAPQVRRGQEGAGGGSAAVNGWALAVNRRSVASRACGATCAAEGGLSRRLSSAERPKRPLTAYFRFVGERQGPLRQRHPGTAGPGGLGLRQGRFRLEVRRRFCSEGAGGRWEGLPREVGESPALGVLEERLGLVPGDVVSGWWGWLGQMSLEGFSPTLTIL